MKILTTPSDIRQAVTDIKPKKVAVAFVGLGWEEYVSGGDLSEIILWPTVGSNPKAIDEIMKKIGPENVYFLDGLHAKFYLGKECALLGSCNLSNNGMSDNGLYEAAVLIHEKEDLKYLSDQFENYKELAKKDYPTLAKKNERLKWLYEQTSTAIRNGYLIPDNAPRLEDYVSGGERIHVTWYTKTDDTEYNLDQYYKSVPEAVGIPPDEYFTGGTIWFHESDDVQKGDWILCWQANENGMPNKRAKVEWFFVDHLINNMVKNKDYTKLAGQAGDITKDSEPFVLDPSAQMIIKECLAFDKFKALRSEDDEVWHLKQADEVTPDFIKTIQAMAQNPARKINP